MSADSVEISVAMPLSDEEKADRPAKVEPMPLPRDAVPVLLSCILFVLILFAFYFAASLVVPLVLAFTLNFLLQPAMRVLENFHVPKMLAGLLLVFFFFGTLAALATSIAAPAANWVTRAPESLTRLETRLEVLKRPLERLQLASQELEKIAENPGDGASVTLKGPGFADYLFSGTRSLVTGFLSMSLLLYFLLISGDVFLRRIVEILPTFSDKKQAVEISHEIERNISIYLVTITFMNTMVGLLTAIETYLCGLPDPILWGAVALLLNYVLLLGPLVGVTVLSLAGLLSFDGLGQALLPAGLYLAIHLTESQLATPLLLARRFTLNPVAVVMSLLFWYWMWGVAGALLAIPLLAGIKITCDRVRPLMALGHFLGGDPRSA